MGARGADVYIPDFVYHIFLVENSYNYAIPDDFWDIRPPAI